MIARAEAKYLRLAPLKVRQVIDLIRGKKLDQALAILSGTPKRSSLAVKKLLESVLSNAKIKRRDIEPRELLIADIQANQGPMLKRVKAGAMGRAMPILRRTTHIRVSLEETRS